MYFSLGHTKNNHLPFHYNINGKWLSTAYDLEKQTLYGYKPANYVEFIDSQIKFSYLKDFKLMKNDDIILTNLEIEGEYLPNDIIEYDINSESYSIYEIDISVELNYNTVKSKVFDILTENILNCVNLYDPKIVYTAGLDSGLIAYIAQQHNIDFTCVMLPKYKDKFKNLPFKRIRYSEMQKGIGIDYGRTDNIREGLYQHENNNLITGYFGDNTMLHHVDLFYQTEHLHPNSKSLSLYDNRQSNNFPKLNNKQDILNAVLNFNRACYHRQWFSNFQMLDPYRDPRLFETILRLPLVDLIEQFGTAKIQKDIMKSISMEWYDNLCKFKNDYTQFN